ncbi:MAG TPA: deoxynucleoside kinase [Chitinophagaceae bacterium]|nr:deoxynucleoside kinase [Chitinophagaceae bacterium]
MQYQFISVEGNIGSGKTTLAAMLADHFNGKPVLEQFAENPFLARFYEDPQQFAFPLELFFLAERYKQLKDTLQTRDIFGGAVISDYLFTKSLLFARVNLPEEEYRIYQKLFDILSPQIVQPDLLIYLHAPLARLMDNIRKRNRSYEQKITPEYLFNLQEAYVQYIKQHHFRTLVIDVAKADFAGNPTQFGAILDALERTYDEGQHYLGLE